METSVDNTALYLGANNKQKTTLEVPAGALRTISSGTALTQKAADGSVFELHSENLTDPIQGTLNVDLVVLADAGVTSHGIERVYNGHIDTKIYAGRNGIADIDVIPAGATLSHRLQLENKGFKPVLRHQVNS